MTALRKSLDVTAEVTDSLDLSTFGYEQKLHRSIGSYGSFAAGFSFVSILTTVFQLFSFGFGFGGPSFFWTWPIVFIGQILVALCFAELAARYPISGCIYQWATRLGGALWGWMAGWLMLVAQVVTVAAAAIALEIVLPSIWSGFNLVDNPTENAVVLGSILLVITTTINAVGVRVMSIINSVGVTCELVGVVLLCIALFSHAERGPGVVLHTGAGVGHGPAYLWSFIISGLMAAYVMVGFDSAGELSEETKSPRRTAPRTILRALVVSGIGGAFMLMATLMAAPSVTDGSLGDPTTVPVWRHTPGSTERPWLLRQFDRLRFVPVSVDELADARAAVTAGAPLHARPATFTLAEVEALESEHATEIATFRARRQSAFDAERAAWGGR